MRILVLGGTHFVGRALVETFLAHGDDVTTLTSGASGPPQEGARATYADRRDPAALRVALADGEWDAVVDTWSQGPTAVRTAVQALRGRAGHWTYVSSRSVYADPLLPGIDEEAPVVDGDPEAGDDVIYPHAKRGGELAALEADAPVLLARAGLVLGPWEDVGRLPFWLDRCARGGPVPAPGPRDLPLQYVDARDLADLVRRAAGTGAAGPVNVVSPRGHATMGSLLDACVEATGGVAEPVWLDPRTVAAAGVEPWTELPVWLPPDHEYAALHDGDVSRALALGLANRPVEQTVADTWEWVRTEGMPGGSARGRQGMDDAAERRLWEAHAAAR